MVDGRGKLDYSHYSFLCHGGARAGRLRRRDGGNVQRVSRLRYSEEWVRRCSENPFCHANQKVSWVLWVLEVLASLFPRLRSFSCSLELDPPPAPTRCLTSYHFVLLDHRHEGQVTRVPPSAPVFCCTPSRTSHPCPNCPPIIQPPLSPSRVL